MGDFQERSSVSSPSFHISAFPTPPTSSSAVIDAESWVIAEERTDEILCTLQPALVSDKARNEIIEFVRTLINDLHGVEVVSFGSVPLKTYLPDGDIDLTVLTHQNKEEEMALKLCRLLESGDMEAEFVVTDVQYIRAQVKVIKCNIKNIPVDISFNQMAGLCALCFLEQMDQILGRNHLFKRSIILIKAWCYYESRILGANSGLISTYALSILVLYIINLFYSSLSGPLSVLYKFLVHYAAFDWNHYCVSVNGPVPISSLPEINVSPEVNGSELLLSEKFFKECTELYAFTAKASNSNNHSFLLKHLNIVDPLKHSNNLGRSVTKGNFERIRHAFAMGARTLKDVLTQPGETMGSRLEKYFATALDRNGKGQRLDVYNPVAVFGTGRSETSELNGDFDCYYRSLVCGQWYHGYWPPGISRHNYMPSTSQIRDRSPWDIVHWYLTSQKNEFYQRCLNVPTSAKSKGTCPYIPDVSNSSYADRFKRKSTRNSWAPAQSFPVEISSEPAYCGVQEELAVSETEDSEQPLLKSPRAGSSCSSAENCLNRTTECSPQDPVSSRASASGSAGEREHSSS